MYDLHIATLRVGGVNDGGSVPGAGSFSEDEHVVPVQMDGVCEESRVRDVDSHGGVGAEVVDVPFWVVGVAVVAGFGEKKDWLVVVCSERFAVHGPLFKCEVRK